MKAWRLERPGGELALQDIAKPDPRPGSVLVRIEAMAPVSYLKSYVRGELPGYSAPKRPFTIGTNGVGEVAAVGADVWHLKPGQRVILSPHFVARENVADPAQILIALTSVGPISEPMMNDWPDGTLAEYALVPAAAVTPADGLDAISSIQLAVLMRYIVPFGGFSQPC